ncbi:hypothetical protein PO878_20065 [Iamia majanohamensis]|uniref:Uncharacterized protein n=1 Tax=Iamia majanohamensis TaxID=467976 RepID=A0AAE9YFC9_9ACTN|nr:hypothetical protein [Iamia majanohamensis]WCO66791.1 hypothetical protein PO878_20065 [Iamia majanohamensis]
MPRFSLVVRGPVGPLVLEALGGFAVVESDADEVRLEGEVADEAALHGVLRVVQDHRLELHHVDRLPTRRGPHPCG